MGQESAVSEKPAADKKPATQRLVGAPHAEDNSREQAVERGTSLADSSTRQNLSTDAQDIDASRSQAKAELDRLIQAEQNLPGLALWERPATSLHRDTSGQIDQITDDKGNTFKFQHDASGNITSFTDRDGVEYKSENGFNFRSSDGKSLNGIFGIDEKTETIHFLGMEGHYEWRRNGDIVYTPAEQQRENQGQPKVPLERRLDNAVTALIGVTQNINGAHFREGQKKDDLSATALSIVKDNRDHLDDLRAAYKKAYPDGDLDKDLLASTTGPARERLEKMLACKDQAEFDAWEITNATRRIDALVKNHTQREDIESPTELQERAMQERILRETLNGLSPEQIERINTAYKQLNDGKSLAEALDCHPNISEQTKQALRIEISGDSHYNQFLNLGYNALNYRDLALFKEAMRNGTAEEREAFAQQYSNALPDIFKGKDLEIAQQYLKNGELDLATRIRENVTRIGFLTNKGAIEHLLDGMSTQEHIDYIAGAKLQEQTEGLTPEQEKQRDFYKNVSEALKAAGNEKDVVRWNDLIMNGGSLVSDLLKQHGKGKDAIFNTIENMKPVDFARLHDPNNPDFRRQVIEALGTMFGGEDLKRATELVDAQIRAEKYGDPETRRSLHESLVHKMADPPIDGERVLSSIVDMAPSERERLRSDPEYQQQVRNDLRKMLGTESGSPTGFQTEMYRVAADKLLAKIENGQEPKVEPIDRVLIASQTMTDCSELAKNIEEAYKADPTLKERINKPQTAEDEKLAKAFDLALQRSLLEKSHLVNPDDYSVLLREGSLPIDLKIALHDDFQGKLQEIARAGTDEKAQLSERAFDGMSSEQRQVAENVAREGLQPEHALRAFVLDNSGMTNDQLESMFARMTPAQVQAAKEKYELAYERNLNGDLLPKIDHEHFADVERLLSTELNPREMLADVVARDEKSKTGLAGYIAQYRDGTTMQSSEAASQFLRTVQDSESFKNLSPDMQRQLREYMEKSFTQQRATKEEIADIAVTSAVIGASVATAVATGGTSLVAAAAFGAVGAAAQTVGKETLMGLDADPSVRWRQGARGFVEGATGVIGVPKGIEAVRGGWLIKATADGFVSGGAGGAIEGAMDYDPNKSIADNAAHVGSSAADGAVQGTWSGAGFTVAGAGFASLIRAGAHARHGGKHAPEVRVDQTAPAISLDTPMDVIGRAPESVDSIPSNDHKNITEIRKESGSADPTRVEVFAVDESGARSSVRQFSQENGIWLNEKREPMGTSMRVLDSGAIVFTGEVPGAGSGPFVGQTVDAQSGATIAAITVKPDGESFAQGKLNPGGDGFIVRYNANNELQRLTVSTGMAQISRGADGIWRDAHGMPFGKALESTANGIKIKPVDGYSFPGDHPNVRIESIELRRDGSLIKHYENPQANPDKIVPRSQNDFAVPDDEWEYKEWRGYIKPALDGNGHEIPGQFVEEIGNGKVIRDSDDRILGSRNADGYDLRYSGHDPENLDAVEYWKDGKLEYSLQRSSSGKFDKVFADGGREHLNIDRVSVEPDGSVTQYTHFEKTLPNGKRFTTWKGERHGTDGITVHIDEFGHERVDASALKAERARFDQLNERLSGTDENRAQRFDNLAITWERQARANGISEEEIANVYHNINKLMSADNAAIPLEDREVLAQQFMLSLANNNYIDQGPWQTCNVTAGHEVRAMVHRPSIMADMLAQVATTGQYISVDGHIIDMKAATGTLFAQSDSVRKLGRPTVQAPATYSDLSPHDDGPSERMYSDQILQSTLVNLFWQQQTKVGSRTFHGAMTIDELRAGQPYNPADLRYEIGSKTKSKPQSSRAVENITDYSKVPPEALTSAQYQRPATNPLTGEKVPVIANEVVTSPQLNDALILKVDDYLYGSGAPKDHLILTDRPGNPRNVNNEQELVNRLLDLKKQGGKFPVVVAVECSNIVDVNGVPNTSRGGHVINVHDIFESPPGSGKYGVYTTNQWGARFDYLENKPLPTDELYRWMKRNDGANVGASIGDGDSRSLFAAADKWDKIADVLRDHEAIEPVWDLYESIDVKVIDEDVPLTQNEVAVLNELTKSAKEGELTPELAKAALQPIAKSIERTAQLRQLMAKLKIDDPELSDALRRAATDSITDDELKRTVDFTRSTIALREEVAHNEPLYGLNKENWEIYQQLGRQILENKNSEQAALLNEVRSFAQKNAADLGQDDINCILRRISENDGTVTESMESYKGPRTREREAIRQEFQDPQRIKPADERLKGLTTLKYDKIDVQNQLAHTRALISDARGSLADEIVQKLGLTDESGSALRADILASDLSPRALAVLSDRAKKGDAARIKEQVNSKEIPSELEPYPGTGSNAEYERLLTDMVVSSYVAQSNAPKDNADMQEYVVKIKEFIENNVNGIRERRGVPILIDGTVGKTYEFGEEATKRKPTAATPINPVGRASVCSAATGAEIQNRTLSPAQLLKLIEPGTEKRITVEGRSGVTVAEQHSGRQFVTTIVPVRNGIPITTAEHFQSHHGDRTGDLVPYRESIIRIEHGTKPEDGLYKFHVGDSQSGAHVYMADIKNGIAQVYDPLRPWVKIETFDLNNEIEFQNFMNPNSGPKGTPFGIGRAAGPGRNWLPE